MKGKDQRPLTLVGPTRDNPVLDPQAVLHLDNRLYINLKNIFAGSDAVCSLSNNLLSSKYCGIYLNQDLQPASIPICGKLFYLQVLDDN